MDRMASRCPYQNNDLVVFQPFVTIDDLQHEGVDYDNAKRFLNEKYMEVADVDASCNVYILGGPPFHNFFALPDYFFDYYDPLQPNIPLRIVAVLVGLATLAGIVTSIF